MVSWVNVPFVTWLCVEMRRADRQKNRSPVANVRHAKRAAGKHETLGIPSVARGGHQVADSGPVDLLVIGGGINGAGIARDAAGRGLSVVLCEKDDLISVPANTLHWFDMGPNPLFTAIRLFNNPDGWVAKFSGEDIATRFPLLEN